MQIVIVGAGTTGIEIAQALALSGDAIALHDLDLRTLRLALAQISRGIDAAAALGQVPPLTARRAKRVFRLSTDLQACCAEADLVIEAIQDRMEAKQTLFRLLDEALPPTAALATSTSLLSVTALAASTRLPERVIGLHWLRPTLRTGLVEIVRTPHTRPDLLELAQALVRRTGKSPLVVQDSPGLIVNRIAQAYFGEALSLLDGSGLDAATIDRLLEAAGFASGPFRQMDFLGIDRVQAAARAIYEETFHAAPYRPHPRLQRMIHAGQTGAGSRAGGFYPPTEPAPQR